MQSEPDFEAELAFRDNFRRERAEKACQAHLDDLIAVYGEGRQTVQPGVATRQRACLATISGL